MTENKKMREQMALHTYKQQIVIETAKKSRPANARRFHEAPTEPSQAEQRQVSHNSRTVTVAPEVDPSTAWQTFAQRRRARSSTRPVPRRFEQTGMRASSGQIPVVRRPLPPRRSPVPVRSGRQRSRRSLLWKILGGLAFCLSAFLLTSFAFSNNAFRIAQVNVIGTHNDELIHAIQRMGMQGQNIFLLNVAVLKGRIEASPLVASATLSKQWPNQLTVDVVERAPVVLWQTPQGTYSVDSRGIVIAPVSDNGSGTNLGTVVDSTNQGKQNRQVIRPGTRLDQATVDFAADVFKRLPTVAGNAVFKLHYDGTMYASSTDQFGGVGSRGTFVIESSEGWKAYLGSAYDANPLDNRLIELQQIIDLAQKEQLNLATIDLRYGLRPVYTLK